MRTITTENPTRDAARHLRYWGDPHFVAERLSVQNPRLSPADRRRTAAEVAAAILQGLEFLESAAGSTALTKPLPMFYSAENLSKAAVMFRDPSLHAQSFRVHGMSGEKQRRNSVGTLCCRVLSSPKRDVFSRVLRILNCDYATLTIHERDAGAPLVGVTSTTLTRQTPPPPALAGRSVSFRWLVRQLPELIDDVNLTRWGPPFVVHAPSLIIRFTPPGRTVGGTTALTLRHGHVAETRGMILGRENIELRSFTRTRDALDVVEYEAPFHSSAELRIPYRRLDVFGETYIDLTPGRSVASEITIYLLAVFILSDVVRYQVDQWKRLLDDHPGEAILVDRFLDIALRKLPNLILCQLENDLVQFKFAR